VIAEMTDSKGPVGRRRPLLASVLCGLALAAFTLAVAPPVSAIADESPIKSASETDYPPFCLVLLTDMVLPGDAQGENLAAQLHASRPDLPVIYMSGYTQNGIVHGGRLDEGVDFLEKPFTPGRLAALVREVLDRCRS
jgi:DNA-binding NtrC family response regulator